MISKKDLKKYDFESMNDYYNYIIESRANGQPQQVQDLINDMSVNQYSEFIYYVLNSTEAVGYYLYIRI